MDAEKVYKMTRATQRADKLHAVACREAAVLVEALYVGYVRQCQSGYR
jgi:hypothetical protein